MSLLWCLRGVLLQGRNVVACRGRVVWNWVVVLREALARVLYVGEREGERKI
jgi:hypothetical protein